MPLLRLAIQRTQRHQALARLRGLVRERPAGIDDATWDALDRAATSIEIRIDDRIDGLPIPAFVAIAHGKRLAIITSARSRCVELDDVAAARVVAAARAVVSETRPQIVRAETILRLRVDDSGGVAFREVAADAMDDTWSRLLKVVLDAAG
jgi:hypothetical protein